MKSISAKVAIWSAVALFVSLAFFVVATQSIMRRGAEDSFAQFNKVFFRQAIESYQHGGAAELAQLLGDLNRPHGMQFHLTDRRGRDLATGEDRSAIIHATVDSGKPFIKEHGGFQLGLPSADQNFVWLVSARTPPLILFAPFYVMLIAAVAVLYWLVMVNIAQPLKQLATVVDRFGRGDLTARANNHGNDEVGNLGRSFNAMAERIETLLLAERQLLQDVSHELRSPLARLTFEAEMVRKTTDRDRSASRLRHEVERLNELVATLIDMTRAEGEPGSIEKAPLDVAELLESIAEDCAIEASDRGTAIDLSLLPGLVVDGNAELLRRAFENVLRNGIRYSPESTAVELSLQRSEGSALITIRDHGIGIPPEMAEKIFNPFFRIDSSRDEATGGLGLGLAIARRAIHLHQGQITVSDAHPGACFKILLPLLD